MSQEKLARRKKMGDDPTAMTQSNATTAGAPPAQPLPDMPQSGKAGNMMNNPMNGQSMGGGMPSSGSMSGQNMFPYGDMGLEPNDPRMGAVGFAQNSGTPQNLVGGRMLNQAPYNSVQQPQRESMDMMEPYHLAQSAGKFSAKHYGEGMEPPYKVGPIGMMGTPIEMAEQVVTPGNFPFNMPEQSPGYMPLQGMPNAEAAAGMNMGTGNRNEQA